MERALVTSFGSAAMDTRPPCSPRGYTLVEMVAVLSILGVLAALATPSLVGMIGRWRINSALDQFRADLHHARFIAISTGVPVEVRFTPSARRACLERYELVALSEPERRLKELRVEREFPGVCLSQGRDYGIRFNNRGMPRGSDNRKILARQSLRGDSMTLSSAGRLYRFP